MLAQDRVNRIKLTSKPYELKREQRVVQIQEMEICVMAVCTNMVRFRMVETCTKGNAQAPCMIK